MFKLDFLRNEASRDKILFHIFNSLFYIESFYYRLYHSYQGTLYMYINRPLSKSPTGHGNYL